MEPILLIAYTDGDLIDDGEEIYKGTSPTGENTEPKPSYSEVVSFLESDKTDENGYVPRGEEHPYVCEDFSATLGRRASREEHALCLCELGLGRRRVWTRHSCF